MSTDKKPVAKKVGDITSKKAPQPISSVGGMREVSYLLISIIGAKHLNPRKVYVIHIASTVSKRLFWKRRLFLFVA